MTTVIITSVSVSAAKAALCRLASFNGMVYAWTTCATGNCLTAEAVGQAVRITSDYYGECSLLEIANRAAGRGTVKMAGK
jgi:hypothetical protein